MNSHTITSSIGRDGTFPALLQTTQTGTQTHPQHSFMSAKLSSKYPQSVYVYSLLVVLTLMTLF